MPHLWYVRDGEWIVEALGTERTLGSGDGAPIVAAVAAAPGSVGDSAWALVATPSSVLVNGEPLLTGIRLLRDRDEIMARGAGRFWYSAERIAEARRYEGADGEQARCPRCRREIDPGRTVVPCPKCGAVYHHEDESPCFAFHDKCVTCGGPTGEVGEPSFGWTPCGL